MSATLLHSAADVAVYHAHWRDLRLAVMDAGHADALIVDAPYSERTHAGTGTMERHGTSTPPGYDDAARRAFNYTAWTPSDVHEFVTEWARVTRGWMVSITDHVLAPAWESAFASVGLTTFAPLPFYSPGSRVRLAGDGPSNWTTWIVVARPRALFRWGTLPGGYQCSAERDMAVLGGKPLWLMERLVEDYTRPGQLVVDPCCGAGTTLEAARRTGRRAIGGDVSLEHARIAAERLSRPTQRALFAFGGGQ